MARFERSGALFFRETRPPTAVPFLNDVSQLEISLLGTESL